MEPNLIKVTELLDGEALVGGCQHRELCLLVLERWGKARLLHATRSQF